MLEVFKKRDNKDFHTCDHSEHLDRIEDEINCLQKSVANIRPDVREIFRDEIQRILESYRRRDLSILTAYYSDEIRECWLIIGKHEKDIPESNNWRSWEQKEKEKQKEVAD